MIIRSGGAERERDSRGLCLSLVLMNKQQQRCRMGPNLQRLRIQLTQGVTSGKLRGMTEVVTEKLKLGQVRVDHDAFGLDLRINDGYQAYSAELLRLALLVLTGLSAVWIKVYLLSQVPRTIPGRITLLFLLAFGSATLSALAALAHRYTSADSLSYHLNALRRRARNRPAHESRPSDVALAERAERKRDLRFKWSALLLRSSAMLLFIALLLFCSSMANLMFSGTRPQPSDLRQTDVGSSGSEGLQVSPHYPDRSLSGIPSPWCPCL